MNRLLIRIATVVSAAILLCGSAFATQKKPHKMSAPLCPVCHMPLSRHKTAMNTVAIRLKKGGPIWYCCSKCKMPASMLVMQAHVVHHRKVVHHAHKMAKHRVMKHRVMKHKVMKHKVMKHKAHVMKKKKEEAKITGGR